MEWNVKNAVNRDVERQHLNKILKEIAAAIAAIDEQREADNEGLSIQDVVGQMVENNVETGLTVDYDPVNQVLDFAVSNFIIRLAGDVTGSAEVNGLSSVTINTEIDPSLVGIPEAPMDAVAYWRREGQWEFVGYNLERIRLLNGTGFPAMGAGAQWNLRQFAAVTDELTVANPAGDGGNVTYGLADVTPDSGGTMKTLAFDAKGRRVEESEATTDDLPEGDDNLYYTDTRVYLKVKDTLQEGANVELTPDDIGETITVSVVGAVTTPSTPTDGDILEYNDLSGAWLATKDPRSLRIDGGNF